MICEGTVKRFCCEDISHIENYDKAIADTTQVWHCHHRRESDENLSKKELISMDMYFHRPASELIFLTPFEHKRLHHKDEETKKKISDKLKGIPHPWNSHPRSEETKAKISDKLKGENNPNFGKSPSSETRKKQSESMRESWKRRKEKS